MSYDPRFPREDELAVLGICMMADMEFCEEAVASARYFFSEDVRKSMLCVSDVLSIPSKPDLQSLGNAYRKRFDASPPIELWSTASEAASGQSMLPVHLESIKDGYRRRTVENACAAAKAKVVDSGDSVDAILSALESEIQFDEIDGDPKSSTAREALVEFMHDMEIRSKLNGEIAGIATGIYQVDRLTDGLQLGEMCIVAARPSIGKTAFATAVLQHACIELDIPTVFITAEMSSKALMRRIVSAYASVPMSVLKSGKITEGHVKSIMTAQAKIKSKPVYFVDAIGGHSISSIILKTKRLIRKHGVKLVIVDYVQKLKPDEKNEKRTYEVAEVSGKLKAMAVECNVAVLALAQLNRDSEKEKNRMPKLTDLSDSGQIERDADVVCLLHRDRMSQPGDDSDPPCIIVAKQRDGETGFVPVNYNGQFCRFENLSMESEQPHP